MRILVVEDDESIRNTLGLYVCQERFNHECSFATTVAEAIQAVKDHKPNLVLLDWLLHGETAEGFMRYVHDEVPGLMIVLMTATNKSEEIRNAHKIGRILKKPFLLDELDHILHDTVTMDAS